MNLSRIKFGRVPHFDRRSRKFPIASLLAGIEKPRSYTWRCLINLDQGNTSACTGFSVTHEAAARPQEVKNLTNKIALAVYNRAKQLDEYPGENYDGSSVLGAIKAGVERKWYGEYRWAFGEDDLALAVGHHGPAVLGINWYAGMMDPDSKGIIKPTGQIEGGHAILCNGIDVKKGLYRLHNSWGVGYGIVGECFISLDNMARLLKEKGEACIPVQRFMG
jgi:hypothetical protein